jgi:hypothetical protein
MPSQPSASDVVLAATERWHSVPRRHLPPLVRAEFVDTGDKQYVRMLAAQDELIGLYEVGADGSLKSLMKPWPIVAPAR